MFENDMFDGTRNQKKKYVSNCISFYVFFYLLIPTVWAEDIAEINDSVKYEPEIYRFGPGVHEVDRVILERAHGLIEGVASGVTVLKVKDGLMAMAPEAVIRNLTLVGQGKGVGIMLSNTWSAKVQDVEIENYDIGIKIELSDEGRKLAGGKTLNNWPGALTKGEHWGSRVTLTEIRDVEITGPGDGIVLVNQLKKTDNTNYWRPTNEKRPGEFITATTIWGGHIGVNGKSIFIGDGVYSTKVVGTYLDVSAAGGIVMEYGSRGLTLIGVSLDLNSAARKANTPQLVIPKRAKKSIQIIGGTPIDLKIDYN